MNSNKGVGCIVLIAIQLTIVFIVLKLTNVIDWSWIWVLAPIWIYAGLFILVMAALGILTVMLVNDKKD